MEIRRYKYRREDIIYRRYTYESKIFLQMQCRYFMKITRKFELKYLYFPNLPALLWRNIKYIKISFLLFL